MQDSGSSFLYTKSSITKKPPVKGKSRHMPAPLLQLSYAGSTALIMSLFQFISIGILYDLLCIPAFRIVIFPPLLGQLMGLIMQVSD